MADDEKGTIAREVIKSIPPEDKELAARGVGQTLANVGAIASEVTSWVKFIVQAPRSLASLSARLVRRSRRIPSDRRVPPPPQLLLQASTAYAVAPDELRERYENLLATSMDRQTAPTAHPSFVGILGQVTPLEIRIFDSLRPEGSLYSGYEELASRFGSEPQAILAGLDNLCRLGLLKRQGPALRLTPPFGIMPLTFQLAVKNPLNFWGRTEPSAESADLYDGFLPTIIGIAFHDACSTSPWIAQTAETPP